MTATLRMLWRGFNEAFLTMADTLDALWTRFFYVAGPWREQGLAERKAWRRKKGPV